MASVKTNRNSNNVELFLSTIENKQRKADSLALLQLFKEITGLQHEMWGDSIIGYGSYHYKYKSGREGNWFLAGFSPRKQSMTVYVMAGFDRFELLMTDLGKYKTGKSCLYINKLTDVDLVVLTKLIKGSFDYMNNKYNE